MQLIISAIIPVVVVLALGNLLRRRVLRDDGFWRGLEWLSYWVFTPALFITSISRADLSGIALGPLALGVAAPTLGVAALVLVLRRAIRATGPAATSILQGSIRINSYMGLVFANALHGAEGVAVFAVATAVLVPLINIVCVSALVRLGTPTGSAPKASPWRTLATNPLILSCLAGAALNVSGLELPAIVSAPLDLLAAPALVAGTLVAGAAISFRFRARDVLDIGIASLLKLMLLPLIAAAIAHALQVDGVVLSAIVLITAVPTAPSATVLAGRMGGDVRLIASITAAQTILSVVTLPLALHLLAGT